MPKVAVVVAGSLICAACQPPVAEPALFPLNPGWRWEYAASTERGNETIRDKLTVENRPPLRIDANTLAWYRVNSLGNHYFFKSDDSGIYRFGSRNEVDQQVRLDDDSPPRFVLKQPFANGTQWTVSTHPYLLRRSFEGGQQKLAAGRPLMMQFRIESNDVSVSVPAGDYSHCLLITGQHTMRNMADHVVGYVDLLLTQREWYCPEVGLVRFERLEDAGRSQLFKGGRYLLELAALHR